MFNLEVKTPSSFHSLHRGSTERRLEAILHEILSKEASFEDHADFALWAEESLPLIHWQKNTSSEHEISIYLLVSSSLEAHSECFFNALKRKLALTGEIPRMSLQHFDFTLGDIIDKKLSLAEVRIYNETSSETQRVFNLLPFLAEEITLEVKSSLYGQSFVHRSKPVLVQDKITKFKKRFHTKINDQIFEEAKAFLAIAEPKFTEQRSCDLLFRLINSQYYIHKALLKASVNSSDTRHVIYRILPSCLSSPFASKKVLGIFIGINLPHKYDVFTEEHVLRALQRLIPDAQNVPGGSYSLQRHGNPFKFLYVEFEKKDNKSFSLREHKELRRNLKELLKGSVEKLQPSVFMVNNEEEIIKNILLLNREIRSPSDICQTMIYLEEQTDEDVCFQIILVYPEKKDFLLLLKTFCDQSKAIYIPGLSQIVRHLKGKRPIRAHVFKLRISKTQDLQRSDASLNFYAARRRISELLKQALGEFRDYNGGIILKQGELLDQFKHCFDNHSPELLENFFYGLSPLEVQAVIPLDQLVILFELFLEGKRSNLLQPHDCFVKFFQQEGYTFYMLQAKESSFIDCIQNSLSKFNIDPKNLISIELVAEDRFTIGYVYESEINQAEFSGALQKGIENWKQKLSSIKTLRLAISSSLRPLDPRIQGDEDTKSILKMLFEGLMRIDRYGKIEFGIAESVKISKDKKKYTFQLRPSLWSNNTSVTAHDFEYAWKSMLSPHFKAPSAYLLYSIKNAREIKKGILTPDQLGVRASNKNTLKIELEYPTPYFLELLAQPQFSPINRSIDQSQPTWPHQEGKGYPCNGAFLLRKNHPSQGYELIKNPSYHNADAIHLDSVSIKPAQSHEVKEMFLRDEIDWVGFPTRSIDSSPLPLDQGETVVLHNDSLYWMVFNTRCFPFNHAKVRQALALTINRARIVQNIPAGHWPAFTVLPFQHSGGSLMEESQKKGVDLFEEALMELGLERETFPVLRLLSTKGEARNQIAKILKEEWEGALGVRCQIEIHDNWHEVFARLIDGNFHICGLNWISLINDPIYTLQIFHSESQFINFPRWKNDEFEQLLDKANLEKDSSKRHSYLCKAEEIILREAPVVPLTRNLPSSIKKNSVELATDSSLRCWDLKWASIRDLKK
jgi:oligopeptide transport system substrate-binding protein